MRLGHHDSEPLKIQSSLRPPSPKSPRRARGTLASSLKARSLINLSMCARNRFLSGPIAAKRHHHYSEKNGGEKMKGSKRSAQFIPDLSIIVYMPSSVGWSCAILRGNAVRRLKPSEETIAAGGSTNVMRSPALLSDMEKKCARPSAGARMNTSRGLFNYINKH